MNVPIFIWRFLHLCSSTVVFSFCLFGNVFIRFYYWSFSGFIKWVGNYPHYRFPEIVYYSIISSYYVWQNLAVKQAGPEYFFERRLFRITNSFCNRELFKFSNFSSARLSRILQSFFDPIMLKLLPLTSF